MKKPICKECNDLGKYEIKNAYDPSFSKMIDCEYCTAPSYQKK